MTAFSLRPMEASDGPAVDTLMREEGRTTAVSMSTHYRRDIIEAFQAQHPTSFGVVAVAPGSQGLAGMATAFIDEVTIGGRIVPCAHLENLKVRHDVRRQGLGTRLAEWRIEEARRRFGGDGVIATIIDSTNTASLATAARWSTQVLGPARIVIARTASRTRPMRGVRFRALADDEVGTVLDAIGTFYKDHDLVPRLTPEGFAAAFGPTRSGETIRHYRVAVADDGTLLAGVAVTERFKLMVDHIDRMPLPLAVIGRVSGILPADRVISSIELNLGWHAVGRVDALRGLWDAIRVEWHGRATNVVAVVDPRGSLIEAFHVGRTFAPRVELMAPVHSTVRLDPARLLYLWR